VSKKERALSLFQRAIAVGSVRQHPGSDQYFFSPSIFYVLAASKVAKGQHDDMLALP